MICLLLIHPIKFKKNDEVVWLYDLRNGHVAWLIEMNFGNYVPNKRETIQDTMTAYVFTVWEP